MEAWLSCKGSVNEALTQSQAKCIIYREIHNTYLFQHYLICAQSLLVVSKSQPVRPPMYLGN